MAHAVMLGKPRELPLFSRAPNPAPHSPGRQRAKEGGPDGPKGWAEPERIMEVHFIFEMLHNVPLASRLLFA